jgi:hypothetical protein
VGRLRTLKAIQAPLIATTTAPAGTVGGVALAPIVSAYAMPKMYINTFANTKRAPAHLGSVPERQTATPTRRMWPTNPSKMTTRAVSPATVLAKMSGSASNSSRTAQNRPQGGLRAPGTEQGDAEAGSAYEKLQSEREAKGVEEDLARDVEERQEREQIKQEEREENASERKRERKKARGQEESS